MIKAKSYWNKNKHAIYLSLVVGMIATVLTGFITKDYADATQHDIAQKMIRLHVIANSDSNWDQAVKLQVRDAVVARIETLLDASDSLDASRTILQAQLTSLRSAASQVLRDAGADYGVTVSLQKNIFFPTKYYGGVAFPAGAYEALQVKLGEAAGQNWWCCLFPPLCFVDATHAIASDETKAMLQEALTPEAYKLITSVSDAHDVDSDSQVPYKIKFKIVEVWQTLFP